MPRIIGLLVGSAIAAAAIAFVGLGRPTFRATVPGIVSSNTLGETIAVDVPRGTGTDAAN